MARIFGRRLAGVLSSLAVAATVGLVAIPGGGAGVAAAATTSTTATTGPHWASAATAKIKPGVGVTISGVHCAAGFVLTDGTRVFLTVPASCTGVSSGHPTDGCSEAQVPPGLKVTVKGALRRATVVYSSFTRMQLLSTHGADECQNNSLALVQLSKRDIRRTNPSVPLIGGPTGVASTTPSATAPLGVLLANASTGEGAAATAQWVADSSHGWAHTVTVDSSVSDLNLGSPVLTQHGKALGMLTLVPSTGAGRSTVSDLGRELRVLRNTPGFGHVHLAKGTAAYRGPTVPALISF